MKITKINSLVSAPEDFEGAMMQYKPLTKKQTEKVAAVISKHKEYKAEKSQKKLLQKAS